MNARVHELDFASTVAGWVNSLIEANRGALPVSRARIEGLAAQSRKRRDFTLLDSEGKPCLTGEIKLPWAADGHSPFVEEVILDARKKAEKAGASWFFTWNVNELVLWPRGEPRAFSEGRRFDHFSIASVRSPADLDNPKTEALIRSNTEKFIHYFASVVKGERVLERRPPDIYFIHALESFLERPIELTKRDLDSRSERPDGRKRIEEWMRDRLGWTLGGEDLLLRASKYANYSVANKLIFYEALRKRFSNLRQLKVPKHIDSGERLFDLFAAHFDDAQHLTGDYETVFGLDPNDIGDRVPFYDDSVIESWVELAKHIHHFDFSKLDYDVIGQIFESLIAPEERHKFGQYYTRPEVVDLINSFCIRDGTCRVMDPGCGGGTFLVRAYARKKRLAPRLTHAELLTGIHGVDISRFATHLSTINLAARDLIGAANYPRIARSDFFDLDPAQPFVDLPDEKGRLTPIEVRELDAVVGNPPYVRQEDIPKDKKEAYWKLVRTSAGFDAPGRSDLHCYFWPQASRFLKKDGWLGFLTSSQWLDVEYGFELQKWLLENFRIAAIIESRAEPWFIGARVATAVTIARRETNPEARVENVVRFVELRRPVSEILAGDGTSAGMIAAADSFRDVILASNTNMQADGFRIRCVTQCDLWEEGVRLSHAISGKSTFFGGKWGIPLRAPDVWFELLGAGESRWAYLGALADVRYGIKTGADKFFYVSDQTQKALSSVKDEREFADHFGVAKRDVLKGKVKIVRTGTGESFPIEAHFLKPIVHSLMHINRYTVDEAQCAKLVLMINQSISELQGTHLLKYLDWGVAQGIPNGSTVSQRAENGRHWYDLTDADKAPVLWVKERQYRFVAPVNDANVFANCRLYILTDRTGDDDAMAAVLNSSLAVLSCLMHGRPVGVEANWSTMIIDVEMMMIPRWSVAQKGVRKRLVDAFHKMKLRPVLGFLSEQRLRRKAFMEAGKIGELQNFSDITELDQPDRQELDDAVLELLGVSDHKRRAQLRTRLYEYLEEYFEAVRRKEEQAIDNKVKAKKSGRVTPQHIAADIFAQIESERPVLLRRYRDLVTQTDGAVDGVKVPSVGTPQIVDDLLNYGVNFMRGKKKGEFIKTRSRAQAELIIRIVALGETGRHHFIPVDETAIAATIKAIDAQVRRRKVEVHALIAERAQDPELQERAFGLVMAKF